jgi:hypothetical protein
MIGVFTFILNVNGSNFKSGVCMVNNDKLIEYFFILFIKVGAFHETLNPKTFLCSCNFLKWCWENESWT